MTYGVEYRAHVGLWAVIASDGTQVSDGYKTRAAAQRHANRLNGYITLRS